MDGTRFLLACQAVMEEERKSHGIGTLGEKTLHAVLKLYFDPDPAHHEICSGPYVADIRNEGGFIEIQTRGFDRLRGKLEFFLKEGPVTVVYPVPAVKWLSWIDADGKLSPRRRSPKRANACEILPELYRIKSFLGREGLRFCVVLLEVEDYRLKNGWSEDGKRGSTRFERLPVALLDEIWLDAPMDYLALVPETLPDLFTVKEFAKAAKISLPKATVGANVLFTAGVLERAGKVRNAYLYRRMEKESGA